MTKRNTNNTAIGDAPTQEQGVLWDEESLANWEEGAEGRPTDEAVGSPCEWEDTFEENTEKTEEDEAVRAYRVMGTLLLRALERTGAAPSVEDRLSVDCVMRLLAEAMRKGSLCVNVPERLALRWKALGLAVSGDVFARTSLTDDLRAPFRDGKACAPFVFDGKGRLYPHRFFLEELTLAQRFCRLASATPRALTKAETAFLDAMAESDRAWVSSRAGADERDSERARLLAEASQSEAEQRAAVASAVTRRLTVVCGGPGTGKTTSVVKMLLLLFLETPDLSVALAAPTGKATGRMMQSVAAGLSRYAKHFAEAAAARGLSITVDDVAARIREHTIHKWLTLPVSGASRPSREAPLETDVLVVDEASMIDVGLASRLFDAIDPERTRVIVLGDPYQLAAVGPGAVYADLSDADGALSHCRSLLTVSRRYGATSPVGRLARLVNDPRTDEATLLRVWKEGNAAHDGETAVGSRSGAANEFVHFRPAVNRRARTLAKAPMLWLRSHLAPFVEAVRAMVEHPAQTEAQYEAAAQTLWNALSRFRLLAAQRSGLSGVNALNQAALSIVQKALDRDDSMPPGFVLIVRANDDTLGVFNGDVGVLVPDFEKPARTVVWFGDRGATRRACVIETGLLPPFDPAYAMTIHQSQGSEFDDVAIFLPETADSGLATRELLYTGITRAKKAATVFGTKAVFAAAAATPTTREGGLADRLSEFRDETTSETSVR